MKGKNSSRRYVIATVESDEALHLTRHANELRVVMSRETRTQRNSDGDSRIGAVVSLLFAPAMVTVGIVLSSSLVAACGLWTGLIFSGLWLVGFFFGGLNAHGLFYASMCPVFYLRKEGTESGLPMLFAGTVWFLQVPFAPFTGVCMWRSILITQAVIVLVAVFAFGLAYFQQKGSEVV